MVLFFFGWFMIVVCVRMLMKVCDSNIKLSYWLWYKFWVDYRRKVYSVKYYFYYFIIIVKRL